MRIKYTVPFKREPLIPDHWDIPFQGGNCRVVKENGLAKALEITFAYQPLSCAPLFEELSEGLVKFSIITRDHQIASVTRQLNAAMSFLQCYFEVELAIDEVTTTYEAETPEEEEQIPIKEFKAGRQKPLLTVPFDMLTRAIMAAEQGEGPKFEAALASMARKSLFERQFINSFRYSFLLIESVYGNGKFKSEDLKNALKSNPELIAIVRQAIQSRIRWRDEHSSDTAKLISSDASPEKIIDHLVDKRGQYFHANAKRRNVWRPHEQDQAEALALFAIGIVQLISQAAAAPMFQEMFAERHRENAKQAGAEIVFEIKIKYREPEEKFDREHRLNVTTPGTKVTPIVAREMASHFFRFFEEKLPVATLISAECTVKNEKVFDIRFYVNG